MDRVVGGTKVVGGVAVPEFPREPGVSFARLLRVGRSRWCALGALVLGSVVACTPPEPIKDDDATVEEDLADASRVSDAGEDASESATADSADGGSAANPDESDGRRDWARALVGTYAKRSITFSYDDALFPPMNTRNVEHALVRISDVGGELRFESQICSYTVSRKGQGTDPLFFKNAPQFPLLRGRLRERDDGTFGSETMLQHLGFDPSRANSCGTMGRRTKFEGQSWLSGGTCVCSPTSLPEQVDDCRVIDDDGDGLPGISTRGPTPLATSVADYLMVFDYSLKIVDGRIVDDLPEWREVRAQAPACINSERDRCSVGKNELCPGGSTLLLRLSEGASCSDIDPGAFGPVDNFPAQTDCRAKRTP